MSDLISRKKLLEQIKADSEGQEGQYGDEWLFIDTINAIPTAELKVGKWIDDEEYNTKYGYYFAHCSECGYQMDVHENRGYHNYCPNCGAKMERSE